MFSYLTQLLYRFESKPVRMIAVAGLVVLVSAVLLGSLVRWLRRRRADKPESWGALVTGSIGAVLKVLIGLAVLVVMCLHLSFQSGEFARLRGGKSQKNYNAVTTIWGRPHLQRELSVRLAYSTTHYHDRHGMELDPNALKASTQPVGFRKQTVEHTVPGNPVLEADHEFVLRANYRKKGGAWYPGFETDATFSYKVLNFADRELTAHFSFPLPARQGLVDHIQVVLDGELVRQKLLIDESGIRWRMPVRPGIQHDLVIKYHSRGLEHLRFEPGPGRELAKYRLRMVCRGIRKGEINYPIGCMTPTEQIVETPEKGPAGEDVPVTTLSWNLDRAVTRLGMGLILPERKQPGYYVARVLGAASWGLVLLLAMVVVTYLATGAAPHWLPLAVLAAGYHLYYLMTAHIGDYGPGLGGGMAISGLALTALTGAFQLLWCKRFHALATMGLFAAFCIAYPLIRISDYEGLLLTILYVVLFAYTIALLLLFRPPPTAEE